MSGYQWAPWASAVRCTSGPTAGARAFLAWALETFPAAYSLGIYNCRTVRGSSTTSLHGEGRAIDVGFPVVGGRAHAQGRSLIDAVGHHGQRLGIQAIVFDRTVWSAKSPQGRPYGGVHPHTDHAHVELTWNAANRLTLATLRAVTGRVAPTPTEEGPVLTTGSSGPAVRLFQTALQAEARARGVADPLPRFGADGGFGDETAAAVKGYQSAAKIPTTGAIDGVTASLLVRYAPDRHG